MMKKTIALLGAALSLSLVMAGCSGKGEMELGDYKGVETAYTLTVTEENIEGAIRSALESKGEKTEVTGRPVQNGDIANIDYEGLKDGVAFDGGTAKGFDLEIGSGTFIPGFEDGVIGMNTGETKAINLSFPEGYQSAELAGQEVVFNVTLNSIQELTLPELTDALVQELSDKKTVAEFRAYIEENLTSQLAAIRENDLWNTVMNSTKITSYPQSDVKMNIDQITKSTAVQAEAQSMTLDAYLEAIQLSRTDFDASVKEMAEQTVAQQMVANAIAEAEKLTVSDEERKKIIATLLQQTGIADEAALVSSYGKEMVDQIVLQQRVMSFISESAVEKAS